MVDLATLAELLAKGDFLGHPFRGNQWVHGADAGTGQGPRERPHKSKTMGQLKSERGKLQESIRTHLANVKRGKAPSNLGHFRDRQALDEVEHEILRRVHTATSDALRLKGTRQPANPLEYGKKHIVPPIIPGGAKPSTSAAERAAQQRNS